MLIKIYAILLILLIILYTLDSILVSKSNKLLRKENELLNELLIKVCDIYHREVSNINTEDDGK